MEETQKHKYRQVFKATSIFGGVQVFSIIIGLVRSKFVAILLGTSGYGLNGLLSAPLGLIGNLTGMGIGYSAVRDISLANESGDTQKLARALTVLRQWAWVTGLLGMVVTLVMSPWLSQWSFGNRNYTWSFIWLSVTLLLAAISSGQTAVLRGTRRIKETATAGVIGSVLGLFTAIPLFYLYGIDGIVPSLILSATTTLLLSWWFSRKVVVPSVEITFKESFHAGKQMAQMGIMITLSGMITQLVTSGVNIFISRYGSMDDVGLYNAGWGITNQYVGLVFAAMGADYYPRLSGLSNDLKKMAEAVNQQAEIALLILGPVMILYLTSLPLLIRLLYTPAFLPILLFAQWVVLGMLFKAQTWAMGFMFLAKGDSKLFLYSEIAANILILSLNIGCYALWGLEGMGISFTLSYGLYAFIVYLLVRTKYNYLPGKPLITIFAVQQTMAIVAFLVAWKFGFPVAYYSGAICLAVSVVYSLYEMNKRIDLKSFAQNKLSKFK
ncbi:MAG: O-antigen translocase [Breznakibacter sp.]|nr:O-antigen translocase [Breznakibacter sp.]